MRTFLLELKLLLRDRAAWVVTACFAFTLGYALHDGDELAQRQRTAADAALEQVRGFERAVGEALSRQALDPLEFARVEFPAVLPPAPLPRLAVGQADLTPSIESANLFQVAQPAAARVELENPGRLLAGRFDLAFVLVWLFPLFLLALGYDLLAGDRESGTLRMALSRGVSPAAWMARRAGARGAPLLLLALAATFACGAGGDASGDTLPRLLQAGAVVTAYGGFWLAVAALVNAFARSAVAAATALGAAWVALVLVVPTLLNVAVESLHPMPSRAELVASARAASGDAERRANEVVDSFYRDHPELAPPGQRANLAQMRLALQEEVRAALDPVRERFDQQLAHQQAIVERWRFASPAIAAHEALTELAGTGYWRHREFRAQVAAFRQQVSDFYGARIHKGERLSAADAARLPRFEFRPEPAERWTGRVVRSIAGMLVLALVAAAVAWVGVSARRLARA